MSTHSVCVVGKPSRGSTVMTSTTVWPNLEKACTFSPPSIRAGRAKVSGRSLVDCGDCLGVRVESTEAEDGSSEREWPHGR